MNYHNFEMKPVRALDTGQELVADHAFFAGLAHQQVVLEDTLIDNLLGTNPGYGYEFDPGNGQSFNLEMSTYG